MFKRYLTTCSKYDYKSRFISLHTRGGTDIVHQESSLWLWLKYSYEFQALQRKWLRTWFEIGNYLTLIVEFASCKKWVQSLTCPFSTYLPFIHLAKPVMHTTNPCRYHEACLMSPRVVLTSHFQINSIWVYEWLLCLEDNSSQGKVLGRSR